MGLDKVKSRKQRGIAMIIAMLSLLLLAAIGVGFMFMADTENSVNNNYRGAQVTYFAARAGAENARILLMPGGTLNTAATNLSMPSSASNTGVMYVVNPAAGETAGQIDPTSASGSTVSSNPYLDDELCLEQFDGISTLSPPSSGSSCAASGQLMSSSSYFTVPSTNPGDIPNSGQANALPFKWVRITNKQNLMGILSQSGTSNYVDSSQPTAGLQVCFDGTAERVIPAGQTCAAQVPQTMRPVWLVTSLAISPSLGNLPGARRMVQMEVANWPPIYPPGSVSTQAPITLKGNLQVNGYDNCSCTCDPKTGACTSRSGKSCDGSHYAIYTANTISKNGNATTLTAGTSSPTKQNANWPYNVNTLITTFQSEATPPSGAYATSSPYNATCTGSYNLSTLPAVYPTCSVGPGTQFGTYPSGMPDSPSGANPQVVYMPGSVQLTGNVGGAGILIIDGDLDVHGGFSYYGLVLVRGKITFTGGGSQSVNLYGAILAGEDMTATDIAIGDVIGGSFSFQYDACALAQAPYNGPPKLLATHEIMY